MKIHKIVSKFLESNTFVLEENDNCFIFDCGASVDEVKKIIREKTVKAIFLTHGHYDHCFYVLDYVKEFKCKVFASVYAKEIMSAPDKNYGDNFCVNNFKDFIFIEGDGKLSFGDIIVSYFSAKGHSKCCCCYLIEDNLFVGDVLFCKGIGRTDLYGGSKNEMLETLKKIENLDFKNVYSGHDENSNYDQQTKNIKIFERFLQRNCE